MSEPRPVPRVLRAVNVLALVIFAAGAAVYARAWLGMRALREYEAPPDAPLFSAMERFNHFWELSRIGLWLVGASVAVAVIAALARVVAQRRAADRAADRATDPAVDPAADPAGEAAGLRER